MSILVITGTGTGVGKTVVTAAVAALAADRGASVAVVKIAQTGVTAAEAGDLDTITRLSTVSDVHELARYPAPLSPQAAARLSGSPPVATRAAVAEIAALGATRRLVLVEGAGGLLVRLDDNGATLADVAADLRAQLVVVTEAGLGTLNHTALTLEVAAGRGLSLAGVVIGAWPAAADLAARSNIGDLEALAARPLAGALPAAAATRGPVEFVTLARDGLAPALGGRFDAADFRRRHAPHREGSA